MYNILRYYHTLKYLKATQFYYRILNLVKKKAGLKKKSSKQFNILNDFSLGESIAVRQSHYGRGFFIFLNIKKDFGSINDIDWNYGKNGKLWCYNLNYFDFLNQPKFSKQDGLDLISHFIDFDRVDGIEPYPISLRAINWIKFLSKHKIDNTSINQRLFDDFIRLANNLEYHLLGNHLLENGFSLLFGAYYFEDRLLFKKAQKILYSELKEQILKDGAHFELSPMYHQIILFRLLDCINLTRNNNPSFSDDNLNKLLIVKAKTMLGWLQSVTFRNGNIPMVNDSTYDIAPKSKRLFDYAKRLNLSWNKVSLGDSGYRVIKEQDYELFIDIGEVGPDYIPGHAHSDTFSYLLNVNQTPVIVDVGISTYEKNKTRNIQRSTESHNTVKVDNKNQSDVWGGFRVGKRAKVTSLIEGIHEIKAQHNGYNYLGITTERKWSFSEDMIVISDTLHGSTNHKATSYIHFYPHIDVEIKNKKIKTPFIEITLVGSQSIFLFDYEYCLGFNKTVIAKAIAISFQKKLINYINILPQDSELHKAFL